MIFERPLTRNIRPGQEPLNIQEYERVGGYEALRKALKSAAPNDIVEDVKRSGLRGRGGAGFPTGLKWSTMPPYSKSQRSRYFIVNADEMEPGTFKDRLLMEGDPHLLLEGIILSSYAVQADVAYIFLRGEYTASASRLTRAIEEVYRRGYLGKRILGSDFSLDLYLHVSAGRYMCGEETALLSALEGKRALPRTKPPHPTISGLWGKPTVVNNVETICNVPGIIRHGLDWYRELSLTSDEGGTKLYGVSGRVKRPGCWELPMGTTIREILENHAGGMSDGYTLRGIIPGGASTDFISERDLDIKMDFVSLQKAGSRMGTGTMIVLDDRTCPVGMVLNLEIFFARESCGWCTPCREGLPWVTKILGALEAGKGEDTDLEILEQHTKLLGPGHTFCSLAPGAMEPLQSALRLFRADFESHIQDKCCPWKRMAS